MYGLLADVTVLMHFLFVLFVVFGGGFVLRWKRLIWAHLPAAVWGVVIELSGWICPLTYLENHFRRMSGETGYRGSFIENYLEPILYPPGMSQGMHILLGVVVFLINFTLYSIVWRTRKCSKP